MKLIIDIDENLYEQAIRDKEYHKVTGLNDINEYSLTIAEGTPVSNEGDLISRSELKKVIETYRPMPLTSDYAQGKNNMIDYCIAEIDDAPTITPDEIQALMSDYLVYRCEPERQQGEWKLIRVADHCGIHDSFVCPFCNYEREYRKKNFCEECGADLRGEENEQ